MDVSIILITHNKYQENLLVLSSLEKQTYAPSKMEVILVDDFSTDQTNVLKNYTGPFHYKYCRSPVNLGRSGAKNFGLKHAEGKIIIFLDGEVIVTPELVAKHLRHYDAGQELAVSGNASLFGIFSFLYPRFSKRQIRLLYRCMRKEPQLIERLAQALGLPDDHLWYFHKFWRYARSIQSKLPLLTEEDLDNQQYKLLSFAAPYSSPEILEKYGHDLTGFHLAWTYFITRNVSVNKSLLDAVGPFCEEFKGWGSEDWELGYRLFRQGVKIIEDPDIVSYHQEHPFSRHKRKEDQMLNYARFTTLHPQIEVCALTLGLLGKRGLLHTNYIIEDCYQLSNAYPNQFDLCQNIFIKLTQQIPLLLFENKPVTRLLEHAGITKEPDQHNKFFTELAALRETGKYGHYLSAFDLLLAL